MTKDEKLVEKIAEKMYWLRYGEGFKEEFERHKQIWRRWARIILDIARGKND